MPHQAWSLTPWSHLLRQGIYFSNSVCYTLPWSCSSPILCRHRTASKSDCTHLHYRSFIFFIQNPFSPATTESKKEQIASHWNGNHVEKVSIWWSSGKVWFCFGGVCVFETLETSILDFLKLHNSAQTKTLQIRAGAPIILAASFYICYSHKCEGLSFQTLHHKCSLSHCVYKDSHHHQPEQGGSRHRKVTAAGTGTRLHHVFVCQLPDPAKHSSPGHPPSARPSQAHQAWPDITIQGTFSWRRDKSINPTICDSTIWT